MFGVNQDSVTISVNALVRIAEALEAINEQMMILNLRTGRVADVIPGPGERRIKP